MITQGFPNFHEELILGIPWLVNENSTIEWAMGKVTVKKNDETFTFPFYSRCQNNSSEVQEGTEV